MAANGETPPRHRKRLLSRDDLRVWAYVARDVVPMKGRIIARVDSEFQAETQEDFLRKPIKSETAHPKQSISAPLPQLVPLERKLRQHLAKGRRSIDAGIDLHGMRQHEAHAALIRFITGAQARGCKIVRVITGKGAGKRHHSDVLAHNDAERRGILQRMVPIWLSAANLRGYVVGFEVAAREDGGEGALYVMIRRPRA